MPAVRWPLLTVVLLTACPPSSGLPSRPDASGEVPDGGHACLRAFPESVDFGEIDRFTNAFTRVRVTNLSGQTVQVQTTPLEPPFSLRSISADALDAGASFFVEVQFQPADSLLHFGRLRASGLDGGCTLEVPLRGLGGGSLEVHPSVLDFGALEPGDSKTLEVNLINSRRVSVVLEGLGISGDDAGVSAFRFNGPSRLELPPVSTTPLRVTATPASRNEFFAFLAANGNLDRVDVFLRVSGGVPVARVEPSVIEVPVAGFTPLSSPPSFVERVVRVHNEGQPAGPGAGLLRFEGPLFFAVDAMDGGPAGDALQIDSSMLFNGIPPGGVGEVVLRFVPTALGTRAFRVTLFTNDPQRPQHEVTFQATATSLPTCQLALATVPPRVFDELHLEVGPDGGSEAQVRFTNTGSTLCVLDDLRLEPLGVPRLHLTGGADQVLIPPGQNHLVWLTAPDAGTSPVGSTLGFHVLNPSSRRQFIPVFAP